MHNSTHCVQHCTNYDGNLSSNQVRESCSTSHNIIKLHTIFGQKLIILILQCCKDYFGINILLLQVSKWLGYIQINLVAAALVFILYEEFARQARALAWLRGLVYLYFIMSLASSKKSSNKTSKGDGSNNHTL